MSVKPDYTDFQNEIAKRGIEYLIHFTPTINLFSILINKELMSRAKLESLDIEQFDILDYMQINDIPRYDGKKTHINLSISGPNTFLLSRFREQTRDDFTISWCVLKIKACHIYDEGTLFAVTNAASRDARNIGLTGDFEKFEMLFAPNIPISYGTRGRIIDRYPTNVQAEVLVEHSIPLESILQVCFDDENTMAEAKGAVSAYNLAYDTSNFVVDKEIFSPNRSK